MIHTLTHKGWFGLCPVYLGDLNSESPVVVERLAIYAPLLAFSEWMYRVAMACVEWMGSDPPGFPLVVGQKLTPPRRINIPIDACM
jgi:hypothetical protein